MLEQKTFRVFPIGKTIYGEFENLEIIVQIGSWTGENFRVTWQRNVKEVEFENMKNWYGFQVKASSGRTELFKQVYSLLACMNKKEIYSPSPQAFIEFLLSKKFKQVYLHEYTNEYFTEESWPKFPSWRLYINDSFQTRIFASDEKEAKKEAQKYLVLNKYDLDEINYKVQYENSIIELEKVKGEVQY